MRALSASELLDLWEQGQGEPPARRALVLLAAGASSTFAARGIYNLDSNAVIGGHSDLAHPEVAYAIVSAVAVV